MEKAQSKTRFLTEKLKFKSRNEHGKDGFQEEDRADGNPKEDDPNDSCNKIDEASLFCDTHETQESEGGEADLQTCYTSCKKKQGHKKFVPVNDFNISHLPQDYNDNELVEFIKVTADLTVRVTVKMTSTERPEFWPNTKKPYPFYDKRRSDAMKTGTGIVTYVDKRYDAVTCRCHKCQHSVTPNNVWGWVWMFTARHVVFDDLEARYTTCRLFFDGQDSPLVTLDGSTVNEANIEEDWCALHCGTCDVDLLDKLDKLVRHRDNLMKKVTNKYKSSRDKSKLTFIVSHPHGCPKQISVGRWLNKYKVSEYRTKYTYTTCTCPGSSGAHVYFLGNYVKMFYGRHVHSGVNSERINYSAIGQE